jgi:hypothetical protein
MEEVSKEKEIVKSRETVSLPLASAAAIYQVDLQNLYDQVAAVLKELLENKPTNLATLSLDLKPIIVNIVKIVKDYSDNRDTPLDNPTKQALALNLLKHALQKLNESGQIPNDLYANLALAVDFVGPTLIDGCVALFKKLTLIQQDISQNGCKGCAKRNGCTLQ